MTLPTISDLPDRTLVALDGVSIRFRIPRERTSSIKEYAIRRLKRQVVFEDLLALNGIDLQVGAGEVMGVIGRNGAGKSTLLRVIARILRPTSGRVRLLGTVAPLLEVGAGFHPELTGRENVSLNATLLGRSRSDAHAALDSIADFAELADHLDAPLRTYSTGMWARLGFAVATAWRPDILLVDELFSVGDESFRAKCQDRIEGFRNEGSAVFLVTHSLSIVETSCDRAIWLDNGLIRKQGGPAEVAREYSHAVLAR